VIQSGAGAGTEQETSKVQTLTRFGSLCLIGRKVGEGEVLQFGMIEGSEVEVECQVGLVSMMIGVAPEPS